MSYSIPKIWCVCVGGGGGGGVSSMVAKYLIYVYLCAQVMTSICSIRTCNDVYLSITRHAFRFSLGSQ